MHGHTNIKFKNSINFEFLICAIRWTQNCALLGYYAGNSGNILPCE